MYPEEDLRRFASEVNKNFGFLESAAMKKGEVRASGRNDPRDRALVVRYSRADLKIDIAWSEDEKALILGVRFNRSDLTRQERHVYLEPFLEYLSARAKKAIVPYIEHGMSVRRIEKVVAERQRVFEHGLNPIIKALAQKLRANFDQIQSASSETIKAYHKWKESKPRG